MNLFIESIEGGMYVAGIGELGPTEYLKDAYRDSMQFQSLSDLKEQTAGQEFDKVYLKQNTPYDEMCGTEEGDGKLTLELEW